MIKSQSKYNNYKMITYSLLPKIQYPLATKYYRSQGIKNRVSSNNLIMVARKDNIIIGVAKLTLIDDLFFLTGVHVDSQLRGQGIASELISQLCRQQSIIYTFPYLHLIDLYQKLGFLHTTEDLLPYELTQRFNAYVKQGRNIVAMIKR